MIRCLAIDDEPLALEQMCSYIEKTPFLELAGKFHSAVKATEFLQKNTVDLMFVDINMPDLSGMDFVKSLNNPPKVIFTTAYREYAYEGFKIDAADYLVKPISYADFLKSVDKVNERYFTDTNKEVEVQKSDEFLFIKSEYKIIRIAFDKIKYIEGMRDYIKIFLENQKPVMTLMSVKKIHEHLPSKDFMRVHRSWIVNLNKITAIERSRIIFDEDVYIPVSEQYKEEFQEFLDNNFLK